METRPLRGDGQPAVTRMLRLKVILGFLLSLWWGLRKGAFEFLSRHPYVLPVEEQGSTGHYWEVMYGAE